MDGYLIVQFSKAGSAEPLFPISLRCFCNGTIPARPSQRT
jgi:hypothetical protein